MRDLDASAHHALLPGDASGASLHVAASAMTLLRNLDVAFVLVLAAPAIALVAPAFGYAVGAVAWVLQRILQHADRNWITRAREPGTRFGLNLVEAFGRIWLLAGAIVLAGVAGGRPDGLTAAVVIFAAYSIAFAIRIVSGRPGSAAAPAGAVRGAER
jgi:hypothetical protein